MQKFFKEKKIAYSICKVCGLEFRARKGSVGQTMRLCIVHRKEAYRNKPRPKVNKEAVRRYYQEHKEEIARKTHERYVMNPAHRKRIVKESKYRCDRQRRIQRYMLAHQSSAPSENQEKTV